MPKKHQPNYALTKPAYVHPSLQSTRSTSSTHPGSPPAPQTVNERIHQLRREQNPRTFSDRRDEVTEVPGYSCTTTTDTATTRSPRDVHRYYNGGVRPPAGPAAPNSWLRASLHAREHARTRTDAGKHKAVRFCRLADLHDAEFKRLPPRRSLLHHSLKTFAMHWEELAEFEQHYIPALPVPLKEALLSYLTIYGKEGCLDFQSFKILFGNSEEVPGGSGADTVRFLDLTGLLSAAYSLKDLDKSLARSFPKPPPTQELAGLSLWGLRRKEKAPIEVAESWEDEVEENPAALNSICVPIFPNLTRLSLAHPGAGASWTSLLALSTYLNTLTHLSLAYWPKPSTTPNATTTSMVSRDGRSVALGGSHFYSELDNDWAEAANILRRFSHNTYCLKWLDLEGCTWHRALAWHPIDSLRPGRPHSLAPASWSRHESPPGPDWTSAWRQIEYLNLFQGWIPGDQQSVMSLPAGATAVQLLVWLREHHNDPQYRHTFRAGSGYEATAWLEKEKVSTAIAAEIMQQRKISKAGGFCRVDRGWDPSTVAQSGPLIGPASFI